MNPTYLFAALALTCCAGLAQAQVQIPINPRATYLRVNSDPNALPAPAIPLSALGVSPGQWLQITTTGGFSYAGSGDNVRNLIGVFSSSSSLLTPTPGLVNRVPGAITAGADWFTHPTNSGNLATDIPQDFILSRSSWTNGNLVRVPAGAQFLFLSVFGTSNSNWFGNNTDPNNDYVAVCTPMAPETLHGTLEHVELRTGTGGTTTATPTVKQVAPFATLAADIVQRWGASNNEVWLLGGAVYSTGGAPPVGPLPDVHMGGNFLIVQIGVMTSTPGQWSFFVPPGFAGNTILLQGFLLDTTSRNGLLMATDAHRIELQ